MNSDWNIVVVIVEYRRYILGKNYRKIYIKMFLYNIWFVFNKRKYDGIENFLKFKGYNDKYSSYCWIYSFGINIGWYKLINV